MTGDEAWKIVGPIVAAMIPNAREWNQKPCEMMSDAYVTTYMALKQYGNGEEKNDEE